MGTAAIMSAEPAAKRARSSRFAGQTILITGAGGTFGQLGSVMFAQEGANIVAVDMNLKALGVTEEEVKKVGGEIILVECNVTSEEDVGRMVTTAVDKFGKIDLLWNNAGYQGTPAMVAYASSKAAVMCMTVSTAKDLAPFNIRVNAISPALIGPGFMWERQNELHAASGSPYFASGPEVVAKNKVAGVPMKRVGTTEEVVKSVMYLLSDDSSYSTGTNLVVDGGMAAGLKA